MKKIMMKRIVAAVFVCVLCTLVFYADGSLAEEVGANGEVMEEEGEEEKTEEAMRAAVDALKAAAEPAASAGALNDLGVAQMKYGFKMLDAAV